MKYLELTKGKRATVDDTDFEEISRYKWHYNTNGYAGRWIGGRKNRQYIYMHRLLMDAPKGKSVDHIDGDPLNNQKTNLRVCSHRENLRNRGAAKSNKNGYKCIYWDKARDSWSVRIKVGDKLSYLGRYRDIAKAILVRDSFLREYHGEYFKV